MYSVRLCTLYSIVHGTFLYMVRFRTWYMFVHGTFLYMVRFCTRYVYVRVRFYLRESESRFTFLLFENFDGPLILTGSSSDDPSEQLLYVFNGRVLLIIILIASRSLFLCSLVISHFFMHFLSIFARFLILFDIFPQRVRAFLYQSGAPPPEDPFTYLTRSLTNLAPGHESDIVSLSNEKKNLLKFML